MSTDTETLSRALAGIPDEFAPTPEDKRNAWSASSFTLVSMLRGLGDAAPNRYTYTFDYGDGEDFEISVSRVRGVSQLAALMEAESALATVTRERDEARAERDELRARIGPTDINRSAYEDLVAEDSAWLLAQPRTLEREHIQIILMWSIEALYGRRSALAGAKS